MSWRKIRLLFLAFLTACFVIFTSVAAATDVSNIQIFKMGTDVVVPAREVLTEVVAIGGNVTILEEATVTNDAVAIGGDVIIKTNASVGGDAVAIGGQIIKEEGAIVDGNEVAILSNAKVLFKRFGVFGTVYFLNALFYLTYLLVIFIFGIFLLLLLPGHIQTITATMHNHPFKSGMWGLGSIVVITLFSALFSGSIFGFLLIPIANLAFIVAGLLGAIATGLWIGKKIISRREQAFLPFLLGMLILAVISLIPVAGGLIVLMLNLFGLGAVLLSRVGTVESERIEKRFDQLEGNIQTSEG